MEVKWWVAVSHDKNHGLRRQKVSFVMVSSLLAASFWPAYMYHLACQAARLGLGRSAKSPEAAREGCCRRGVVSRCLTSEPM